MKLTKLELILLGVNLFLLGGLVVLMALRGPSTPLGAAPGGHGRHGDWEDWKGVGGDPRKGQYMSENKYDPPLESKADFAHAIGRSLAGAIPVAGQAATELLNKIVVPPIEKRRQDWRASVANAVEELEKFREGITDELKTNEVFIDTLLQASEIALRTSHQEKRKALLNAIQNSALASTPDDALRIMFLHLIDRFSPLHLELLSLLDDPIVWIDIHGIKSSPKQPKSLVDVLYAIHRELEREWNEPLCERVCKDLNESGLLIASSLRKNVNRFPYFTEKNRTEQTGYWFADELPGDSAVSYSGSPTAYRHWTTDLGRQFLAFIKSPIDSGH